MTKSKDKRVVVTGLGVIAPNGIGVETFWKNTLAGKSGIRRVDDMGIEGLKSEVAGHVDGFVPSEHGITRNQQRRLDRHVLFAIAATRMAMQQAGLADTQLGEKLGVTVSNAIGGTARMEQEFLALTEDGTDDLDPAWADSTLAFASTFNVVSSEIGAIYGAEGPCITIPTGCTGGLDALGAGLDLIRRGDASVVISGASEAPLCPVAMAAFDVVGALSTARNSDPERASRPYDKTRDGFVLGEGCGILVLEEREHALARGATILAELVGYGSTNNAYHMTDLPPDGDALLRSLELALEDAKLPASSIEYLSAHGSSTAQNDVNETAAYRRLLGERAQQVPVSSLKSMTGHALAAANAIESVATVMTIHSGQVHPTINYEHPDERCDLDYIPEGPREVNPKVVLKNASGFSGIHSAAIFTTSNYMGA